MSVPKLRLEPAAVARAGDTWRTTWRVRSDDSEAVRLETVTVPHALYRAPELSLNVDLAPSADATFVIDTRVDGGPGGVVENAFVILVARRGAERWRMLFRVRVPIGSDGTPRATVETLTSHRVGFAG